MDFSKRFSLLPLRGNVRNKVFFKLLCLIFFSILIFILSVIDRPTTVKTNHQDCPSDANRNSKLLAKKNVHVLPSNIPVNRVGEVNEKQHEMTPESTECLEVVLPDSSKKFKMCIYDPRRDQVVSYYMKIYGAWEKENVKEMLKALKKSPDLVLVDLGSNIGTFTLPAALTGTEVIAVDALRENHQLLQRSLTENNLQCQVTLVHNAVFNQRGLMRIVVNPINVGGSALTDFSDQQSNKIQAEEKVDAVCLDDLIPMVKGKNVFLKMDIEGSEDAVLECAHQFFKEVKVKVLLMEWINYRHAEKRSSHIKRFLEYHNMVPTWGVDRGREIDLSASDSWPDNVFWMER